MKIYFIYAKIPEDIYNKRIKYIISNKHSFRWKEKYMFGLYAWTKDKKICKEFLDLRGESGIYTLVEKEVDTKEELHLLRKRYTELELGIYRYYYNKSQKEDQSITVVSTKNEWLSSTEYASENMMEFGPKVVHDIDYLLFNKDIRMALDTLGYTTDYDIMFQGNNEERYDNAVDHIGFDLTVYGHPYPFLFNNQLTILLYLFSFMFYGNRKQEENDEEE